MWQRHFGFCICVAVTSSGLRLPSQNYKKGVDSGTMHDIDGDIEMILNNIDNAKLESGMERYNQTRQKGTRKTAQVITSLANILEVPKVADAKLASALRDKLLHLAVALNSTWCARHMYVEDQTMRGWPYKLSEKSGLEMETYQFGYVGAAIAQTAHIISMQNGDHETAASLVHSVVTALYDQFLTADLSKTKLDADDVIVFVPKGAPMGRVKRYKQKGRENTCLHSPEMLNHGLQVARATVEVLRAISSIDWKKAPKWRLAEMHRMEFETRAEHFVHNTAKYLENQMLHFETQRNNEWDHYPGPDATTYYKWTYRNIRECDAYRGTDKDRWEDTNHAQFDLLFVHAYQRFVDEKKIRSNFGNQHVHRMIVTFLNRVLQGFVDGRPLYACDVNGLTELTEESDLDMHQCHYNGIAIPCLGKSVTMKETIRKQCGHSKKQWGWIYAALAITQHPGLDHVSGLMRCDALRTVSVLMSESMENDMLLETWAAKRIFRNYSKALQDECQGWT